MSVIDLLKGITPRPYYDGRRWDFAKWGCPDCGHKEFFTGDVTHKSTEIICCSNPACRQAFCWGPESYCVRVSNEDFLWRFGDQHRLES